MFYEMHVRVNYYTETCYLVWLKDSSPEAKLSLLERMNIDAAVLRPFKGE